MSFCLSLCIFCTCAEELVVEQNVHWTVHVTELNHGEENAEQWLIGVDMCRKPGTSMDKLKTTRLRRKAWCQPTKIIKFIIYSSSTIESTPLISLTPRAVRPLLLSSCLSQERSFFLGSKRATCWVRWEAGSAQTLRPLPAFFVQF